MGSNSQTIYLTVAVNLKEGAEPLGVIDEMDYFFEHSDIESTEIQEVLTEQQLMEGMKKEEDDPLGMSNSEYFRGGRF